MPTEDLNTRDEQIGRLLNEILDRRARGESGALTDVLETHSDIASEVREHLRLFEDMRGLSPAATSGSQVPIQATLPDSIPGYEIIREIHRGGQGVVYEALQLSMNRRTVALKVLLEGPFASPRHIWMFEREVKLIAALRHPNIVVIHDSGVSHGKYYFAMDYVRGEPLDTFVRIAHLGTREIVTLFKQICDAVAYAHQRGVVHRDLKPLNILVGETRRPFVLDFGMAKVLGGDIELSKPAFVSQVGDRMGTLQYMSPEQTLGEPEKIDTRTDIYSLGAILYELLTGRRVYDLPRDLQKAFSLIRDKDPPRPSRVHKSLNSEIDAIVMKALEKSPERRYQSASEFSEDLAAWLDGRPISAKSASSLYVIKKLAFRHGFETLVVGALLISIVSFGAITIDQYWAAQKASAAQVGSDKFAAQRDKLATDAITNALPAMRDMYLGWFLLEWHQNRIEEARLIQHKMSPTQPEYAAMAFLLDDAISPEQLRTSISPNGDPLAYFAAAEREMKAGRLENGVRYYGLSLQASGDHKYRSFVQARLNQRLPASQVFTRSTASRSGE